MLKSNCMKLSPLPTVSKPLSSSIMPGDKYLLQAVWKIFFTEFVTSNVIHLLDFTGNFNRHIKAPRSVTQEDMNMTMQGSEVQLAERYTVCARKGYFSMLASCLTTLLPS